MRRALLALALLAPLATQAQSFPERPITIVLPYAPGSASDHTRPRSDIGL